MAAMQKKKQNKYSADQISQLFKYSILVYYTALQSIQGMENAINRIHQPIDRCSYRETTECYELVLKYGVLCPAPPPVRCATMRTIESFFPSCTHVTCVWLRVRKTTVLKI
jgi:hypothetical protein